MGHESTSLDDRYTMIDDEALEDARRKMDTFQAGRGLIGATDAAKRIEELRAETPPPGAVNPAKQCSRRARYYELTKAGRKQLETETGLWKQLTAAVSEVLGEA